IRDGHVTGVQTCALPILMPAIRRGHKPDHPKGPSGTWTFTTWKRSGWTEYVLRDKAKQQARVRLAVCRVRGRADRKGRRHLHVRSEERRVGKECRVGRGT